MKKPESTTQASRGTLGKVSDRKAIPEGAVVLSETQALNQMKQLILNWNPRREVWPVIYGPQVMAISSGIAGFYFNRLYRKQLQLRHIGRIASYLPGIIFPGVVTGISHEVFITSDVLLGKTECSLCLQTRALLLQFGTSILYPLILAPIAQVFLADRYYTYPTPPLTSYREMFHLWRQLTFPHSIKIGFMCAFQALLAVCVVNVQEWTVANMWEKIHKEQGIS